MPHARLAHRCPLPLLAWFTSSAAGHDPPDPNDRFRILCAPMKSDRTAATVIESYARNFFSFFIFLIHFPYPLHHFFIVHKKIVLCNVAIVAMGRGDGWTRWRRLLLPPPPTLLLCCRDTKEHPVDTTGNRVACYDVRVRARAVWRRSHTHTWRTGRIIDGLSLRIHSTINLPTEW